MRLLTQPKHIADEFDIQLRRCHTISLSVAWAGIGFPSFELLREKKSKIKKAVIGTHFYQTHPSFIERFVGDKRIRFIPHTDGIFHPKLFLFEMKDGSWRTIIGSANFTNFAFSKNVEICTVITDANDHDGSLKQTIDETLKDHWNQGKVATAPWLKDYTLFWDRARHRLNALSGYAGDTNAGQITVTRPAYSVPILKKSWASYVKDVRNEKSHFFKKRLPVLKRARSLFEEYPNFHDMPERLRGNIAGFRDNGQNWGWFGSMHGAGRFKSAVNKNALKLGQALNCIPQEGPVLKDHYMKYIDHYVSAFPIKDGKRIGHGIGTATRLLAMKRPDYFVCLDKANNDGLCEDFGITFHHHQYEKYWDSIIARIQDSNWWQSPRPASKEEAQIWDGRAALLDSLYYDP